ncbi:MAG: prolyl oligopeptidase family serine peptidase [Gammaproteobacteria bacterium]|nr:prolyl oligopeptidase family serine peptidase [Gammaproteobacteria bacterium]
MAESTRRKTLKPYGLWESSLEIAEVFRHPSPPAYPFWHRGELYWLESLPEQGGRVALMRRTGARRKECLTPENYNIRSRVHEYGGKCFCVTGRHIIFNNYRDGELYSQRLEAGAMPEKLELGGGMECLGFADLVVSRDGSRLVAVAEAAQSGRENLNFLAAFALSGQELPGRLSVTGSTVVRGADFYANPVFSAQGDRLAWIEWSLPDMPWDQTRLMGAEMEIRNGSVRVGKKKTMVDRPGRSVCQLGFLQDGRLLFASDSETVDFWNFFLVQEGEISRLTDFDFECGEAHWVFGQTRWQATGHGTIVAVASRTDGDELIEIGIESGEYSGLLSGFSACQHLSLTRSGELLLVAQYADRFPEILNFDVGRKEIRLRVSTGTGLPDCALSEPEFIRFATGADDLAYGYFYPPANRRYRAPEETLPPLIVMVHGGPTSRTTSALSLLKQYFCHHGFALLDINHRGSTGFGRKYRQSLMGQWGIHDAEDIRCGIEHLVNGKRVNPELVFIRGSSAGGYAVLRALTQYPDAFAGGASYYGIGNLVTLSEITHKFESRYTDNLVGECFDRTASTHADSEFVLRSPVFDIDRLSSPVILFQGLEDHIVPPDVSREVVRLLESRGIPCGYVEYPGEGHGFRRTATRTDSLSREISFFTDLVRQCP